MTDTPKQKETPKLPAAFQILVDWERENGTLAAIMPDEYAALCERLAAASVAESPRMAADSLRAEKEAAVQTMEALRKGWEANYKSAAFRAEAAEQSLAEQRKDAERLDWLDKNRAETIKTGSGPVRVFYVQGKPGGPTSIREVIDAAIGSPVSAIREFSSTDKRSSEQTPPSAEQKD